MMCKPGSKDPAHTVPDSVNQYSADAPTHFLGVLFKIVVCPLEVSYQNAAFIISTAQT